MLQHYQIVCVNYMCNNSLNCLRNPCHIGSSLELLQYNYKQNAGSKQQSKRSFHVDSGLIKTTSSNTAWDRV